MKFTRKLFWVAVASVFMLAPTTQAGFIDAIRDFDGKYETIPGTLSGSGMYADIAAKTIAPDLIFYDVNVSYWVDGSHKDRWIWLPPGTKIVPTDSNQWEIPEGAVFAKNFTIDTIAGDPASTILVETRLLVKRANKWRTISYEWQLDQSEAFLVKKSLGNYAIYRRWENGQLVHWRWRFPSSTECTSCHKYGLGVLAISGPNMNKTSPLDASKNQLQDLFERGILTKNLLATNPNLFKWADHDDATASNEVKARSWFAMNCGYCHAHDDKPQGAEQAFDYWRAEEPVNYLEQASYRDDAFPFVLYAGKPDSSYFLQRMISRPTFETFNIDQMPPLITYLPDTNGVKVVSDWICELDPNGPCNPIAYPAYPTVAAEEYTMDPDKWQAKEKALSVEDDHHAAMFKAPAFSALINGRYLELSGLNNGAAPRLFSLSGREIALTPFGQGRFLISSDLSTGVYFLKMGDIETKLRKM